jgi:serine/threonine-protein kinase
MAIAYAQAYDRHMALRAEPRIGSVIAGYRVEALLGRGGMGVVYLAQDLSLERRVALKLLAPELSSEEGFRERFLHESRLAASIDHPNVIPIYEAGEFEGTLFIAMRYVEGSDLKHHLEQLPLEPARALGLLSQVADALDVAHEHGLVHRDVKPSNVLIATQGGREHVYLADSGLSRRLAVAGSVERSHFSGSADYVAPEQVRREPVDGRADLYALGCVLYECLTGRPPLQRDTIPATLFAHLEDEPPPPTRVNPDLPADIDSVVARALAKEPDQRQSSCGQLVEESREALGIAVPGTGWRHLSRTTKLALVLVVLAVAAAAAVPALLLTGRGPGPAEAATADYKPTTSVTVDSLQRIDPATNQLVATFPAGKDPAAIAAGQGSVWTASKLDGTVTRVDPTTNTLTKVISAEAPVDLSIAGGFLWILEADTSLHQVDPSTGAFAQTVELLDIEAGPGHLAAGPDALWGSILCTCGSGLPEQEHGVVEIQLPTDGSIQTSLAAGANFVELGPAALRNLLTTGAIRKINVVDAAPTGIAVGEGAVWVANEYGGFANVMRYDPEAGAQTETIQVDGFAAGIAAGEGAVWVANPLSDTVSRIDPATHTIVERIPVGDDPIGVTAGNGSVWVTNYLDGTVSRIDPATNTVVQTIEVGPKPDHIAVGEGGVWVTVHAR